MKFTILLVALALLVLCLVLGVSKPVYAGEASSSWNLFEPQPAAASPAVDFQLFASTSPQVPAAKPVVTAASPVRSAPRMQWVQVCYGRSGCRWELQYVQ